MESSYLVPENCKILIAFFFISHSDLIVVNSLNPFYIKVK